MATICPRPLQGLLGYIGFSPHIGIRLLRQSRGYLDLYGKPQEDLERDV
jgi:hypothetical protein